MTTAQSLDRPNIVHRRSAFTLIELLVVISIIAMLVAILLPALVAARKSGQAIHCLSRQRQFGLAIAMYQSDYKSYYPVSNLSSLPVGMNWLSQIGPYINPGLANYNSSSGMWSSSNNATRNLYLCPGHEYQPGAGSQTIYGNTGGVKMAHIDGWRVHNYRISAKFGWGVATDSMTGGGPRRIFYGNLAKIPMVGEGGGANMRWGRESIAAFWAPSNRNGIFSHPGRSTNYLFIDGHASNVGTSDEVVAKIASKDLLFTPTHDWTGKY